MISAVVICLNEEKLIEQCISNLLWTDEIVVIDGGSVDKTLVLLKKMKDEGIVRLYKKPFDGHFGDQKNLGISLANGDWVFVFDADEIMEPELSDELKSIAVEKNQYDAVAIPRKNFTNGIPVDPYPDLQFRFFRNYCRYLYAFHEELIGYRRLYTAKNHILHYKSQERYNLQQERYRRLKSSHKSKLRLPHEDW